MNTIDKLIVKHFEAQVLNWFNLGFQGDNIIRVTSLLGRPQAFVAKMKTKVVGSTEEHLSKNMKLWNTALSAMSRNESHAYSAIVFDKAESHPVQPVILTIPFRYCQLLYVSRRGTLVRKFFQLRKDNYPIPMPTYDYSGTGEGIRSPFTDLFISPNASEFRKVS